MKHRHTLYTVLLAMLAAIFGTGKAAAQQAYTEYDSETKTLTFYYDDDRATRSGKTYSIADEATTPLWNQIAGGPSSEITTVVFDPSFADARPTSTASWFADMGKLVTINGMAENLNTSEVTSMDRMFNRCTSLASINLSGFDTKKVEDMYGMFTSCESLEELNLMSFDTQSLMDTEGMFRFCSLLRTIYINTLTWDMSGVTNSKNMFLDCKKILGCRGTVYDVNHIDKDYAQLDYGGGSPGYLSIPPEAYVLYDGSSTLTFYCDYDRWFRIGTTYSLNEDSFLPDWSSDAASISTVIFDPSFAAARPTTTSSWFSDMPGLSLITDIQYLNTSEVVYMNNMFDGCNTLPEVDLSHFDTRKVINMNYMFAYSSLSELDLSTFDTHSVTDMEGMFTGCSSLNTITVGKDWTIENVANSIDMFNDCYTLVGGNGTAYDSDHTDATYARFDFGEENPGYLTGKFEPYAALYDGKLTFYYDMAREERSGIKFDLNTNSTTPPDWDAYKKDITAVAFDPMFAYARPVVTYCWFNQMINLKEIEGIEYLNTSEVTDMTSMFFGCSSLTGIDVSHFDTRKATSMHSMFRNSGITSLDLSNFETWDVVLMGSMFQDCSSLQTIYVGEGWGTASLTDSGSYMFEGCTNLVGGAGTEYDESSTDATYARVDQGEGNPGYLTYKGVYAVLDDEGTLTYYNDGLREQREGKVYNLGGGIAPGWNTMSDHGYLSIKAAVVDPSMATARPTSTRLWFASLNVSEIKGLEYINTSEVDDMFAMFKGSSMPSLDLSHFDTRKVTDMSSMFLGCSGLTELDLSSFDTRNVTNMTSMFEFCTNLKSVDVSSFNTENVTWTQSMFRGCESMQVIDLYNFNTANVRYIGFMFRDCSELTTILVGKGWSTASVVDDDFMFTDCPNLVGGLGTTYDEDHVGIGYAHVDEGETNPGYLSRKDAYAVFDNKTFTFYFDGKRDQRVGEKYDLTGLDWYYDNTNKKVVTVTFDPSFATYRPTSTASWFNNMTHLTTVNGLENLNTSEVTSMTFMFANCEALTSLDLSTLNTEKVTDMSYMFYASSFSALETLDLSGFNTANVADVESMFDGCTELKTITVGDGWNVDGAFSDDMFNNCTSLVGEKGTTYDASFTSASYAHVDGGEENPGYLTAAKKRNPADVNGDGDVNTADVVAVYSFIEKGEASLFTHDAADVDGDGDVNTADVVAIYAAIIGDGGAGSREFNRQMLKLLDK